MRQHIRFQITTLCVLGYIHVVKPEVHDYCLSPLNKSDCGLKTTPVITYWKPGSRCEVDLWRGCPTQNKFASQYECHNFCIFRSRNTIIKDESKEAVLSLIPEECSGKLNQDICTGIVTIVYTYEDGVCVAKEWRGCKTVNSFITEQECMVRCKVDQSVIDFDDLDAKKLLLIEDMLTELEEEFDGAITIEIKEEEEGEDMKEEIEEEEMEEEKEEEEKEDEEEEKEEQDEDLEEEGVEKVVSDKSAESAKNYESDYLSSKESESSEITQLKGTEKISIEVEEEQETTTLGKEKNHKMNSDERDVEITTSKKTSQKTTTAAEEEVKTTTTRQEKRETTTAKKAIKTTTLTAEKGDTATTDEESSTEEEDESGDQVTNEMPFIVTPRG